MDIKVALFYFKENILGINEFNNIILAIEECLDSLKNINGPYMIGDDLYKSDYIFYDNKSPNFISGIGILFPAFDDEIDKKRKEFLDDPSIRPDFYVNTGFIELLKKMKVIK